MALIGNVLPVTYYNSERYQWTLKKMTPDEFRGHQI
ncbi:IS3 family transposase [Paenibacillus favisporus]